MEKIPIHVMKIYQKEIEESKRRAQIIGYNEGKIDGTFKGFIAGTVGFIVLYIVILIVRDWLYI